MAKVVISHRLHDDGMAVLEKGRCRGRYYK